MTDGNEQEKTEEATAAAPSTDAATEEAALEPATEEAAQDAAQGATQAPATPGQAASAASQAKQPSAPRPWHLARGLGFTLVGGALTLILMAADRRFGTLGVPLGTLGVLLASIGVLDLLGGFTRSALIHKGTSGAPGGASQGAPGGEPRGASQGAPGGASQGVPWARLMELGAALVVWVALLKLAVAGALMFTRGAERQQLAIAALTITPASLWLVICVYRLGRTIGLFQVDEAGVKRGLTSRHGFWLIAITSLLYLPLLGSFSLIDPWETHYGEVAREMLVRDDWISLWWAQDGWFWSKPIFDFWLQGLSFSALGVQAAPDQMLAQVAHGRFPQPEWAARMPVFLVSMLGVYVLYRGMVAAVGRGAALIGALILVSTPYWFFLSHQTMTDMPYVGPLAAAMGFLLLAVHTPEERLAQDYTLRLGARTLTLNAWHLLFGAVLMLALPQILYLVSRNLTLITEGSFGFTAHLDHFSAGSGGGNCGLPGNQGCHNALPVHGARWLQPAALALVWSLCLGLMLVSLRHERRLMRLYFLAAWLMTALSAMAKGAPGLVLPLATTAAYVVVTRRWSLIRHMGLPWFVILTLVVALPWYVQMYLRHGAPFTDRLIFHDMFKRAFVHVHDTNSGDDVSFRYYIWQLGYGLFPWTGLAVAGLVWWARRPDHDARLKNDGLVLLAMWFIAGFGMFNITLTKFHHYILPVVPPIAMLTGVLVHRFWQGEPREIGVHGTGQVSGPLKAQARGPYFVTMGSASLLACYAGILLFPGGITGEVLNGEVAPANPVGAVAVALTAAMVFGLAVVAFGAHRARPEAGSHAALASSMGGAIALAAGLVVLVVGRDMVATQEGDIEGQARLMHLFTYNYKRPWPDTLDFTGALAGFTVAAGVASFGMTSRWLRPHATALLLGIALWFTAWGLNSYFYFVAPHWGQRETVLEYYKHRASAAEPIVAYQMNWKGENFYTGNRIPAFVSSGQKFKDWIAEERSRGVRVMYFTTEHSRIGSLKRELGDPEKLDVLTPPSLNNKFTLARVQFD